MKVPEVEIRSRLSADAAQAKLAAYGKEWRESKLPPEVRRRGYHTCRIVVNSDTFTLRLEPQGRGPHFAWRGTISDDAADGCRIVAVPVVAPATKVSFIVGGLFVAIWASFPVRWGVWWFSALGVLFIVTIQVVATRSRAGGQARDCSTILDHVVGQGASPIKLADT